MSHTIAISGSTIMSDPSRFDELFVTGIDHIEIGEFENEADIQSFLQMMKKSGKTFGIHSPLLRNGSKYDLLEELQYKPEDAWIHFEKEVQRMAEVGAQYILVHFPYFQDDISDPSERIEAGLQCLSALQSKYGITIVCEPKLGLDRSPKGIQYLDQFPSDIWKKYGIKLCIDIGDYLLADRDGALALIQKWKDHIKVVHLHNIEFTVDKYIWVPIHPSHESDGEHYPLQEILGFLSTCNDLFWVLEHTPHSNPTWAFVSEGINWLKTNILNLDT
jgi:sugar phosphate isomerase/epimerase